MSSITGLISGGGGGGTPVNGIAQLYLNGAISYTDESGQVWLKTGNTITTDLATYPDATIGLNLPGATLLTSFSVEAQEANPYGLAFNNDGTKMFVIGQSGNDVNEYALSTAFDVSSASFTTNYPMTGQGPDTITAITFNDDGTKMFIVSSGSNDRVWPFPLTTPFDITTTGASSGSFSIGAQDTSPQGIAFSNDGTKMFILGDTNDSVYQYVLSTPFAPATSTFIKSFSVAEQLTISRGLSFNSDGTKMYITGVNKTVNEYVLGVPFDIGQVSIGTSFFTSTISSEIRFNNDGTKMYILALNPDQVYEYSIPETMGIPESTGTYDYVKLK